MISACFLLSGATSLVLEIVWAKKLSYVLGNSLYGSSTVVAAFMAGLALGAYLSRLPVIRRRSPVRLYAALQVLIAAGGFASIPMIDMLEPLFALLHQSVSQSHGIFLLLRFSVVFALVMVPVTLMGMTLPVVVEAIRGSRDSVPKFGGILYGLNTLGAVAGTLAAGYLLIPALGLLKATWLIAAIDLSLALVLILSAKHFTPAGVPIQTGARTKMAFMDAVILFSGLTAIALEVVWFRFLVNVFGASTYALTNMLATYLVGIALGSLLGVRLLNRHADKFQLLVYLQLGVCFVSLLSIALYNFIPDIYVKLYWWLGGNAQFHNLFIAQFSVAVIIVLPPTLLFGSMFPVFLAQEKSERHPVSRVYTYNTIGGIFGSLLAGFVILPNFGIDLSLRLFVTINMLLALVLIFKRNEPVRQRLAAQFALITVFVLVSVLTPRIDTLWLNRGVFMLLNNETAYQSISSQDNRRILFQREGLNGSVAVVANEGGPGDLGLRVSSKPVAVTGESGRRHLLLLGHLPMMFAPAHADVAVIGFGTGITTGAVLNYPGVGRLDVLELEEEVLAASDFFTIKNGDPLNDPRTRVNAEDGRIFLTYTDRRYDVITSDPISPWVAGASSLYSEDFYKNIKRRMKDGGVFCQWLQMGDYASQTYRGVIATMAGSFGHLAVFNFGHDSVILASESPLRLPWGRLQGYFDHSPIAAELASNGIETPAQMLNFFIAATRQVEGYIAGTELSNSDDSVWLEYQMARDLVSRRERSVIANIIGPMIAGRMAAIQEIFPGLPLKSTTEYLVKNPPIFIPEVHELILSDARQALGQAYPLQEWFEQRMTLEKKDAEIRQLWESAQQNVSAQNFILAQQQLEALLGEVIADGYFWIGIEYVRVSLALGHSDKALKIVERLQRMSPAQPLAYQAEIQIKNASGEALEQIISRARKFIPDFKP
ncbi:MAG: fused MFS/spermidine synthase [Xanthomonadales bacterium]|nr:fused MFS/spermidine synthase [Xanthomonadales bacterium]